MRRNITCKITSVCLCALMVLVGVRPTFAGGNLEQIDITGRVPSPIPGQILARVVDIKWDARAIPVKYSVNDTLDQIPNPLGAPFLSLADATAALQESFDSWNNNPASFIDMRITGTTSNPGLVGFDMVNELSFRTSANFGAIASSPSTSLIEDTRLADGDDIDEDGDSDVSRRISVATDFDGDGDIEFPAGFYKAGTILDNDVQFNTKVSNGFRFTVPPTEPDTNSRSVDLIGVATHEFGHSHGLSHTAINQLSASDGTYATMFPFIDTNDPASELADRTLEVDDLAFSSYYYPEGSASSGPAELQEGDIDFDDAYGLITGQLRDGSLQQPDEPLRQPIAGGSLFTVAQGEDPNTNLVSAISGTIELSIDLNSGEESFRIVDGRYVLPVPRGTYRVGVEPLDGLPISGPQVNNTAFYGFIAGQQNFNEEFFNGRGERSIEDRPGEATEVAVEPGAVRPGVSIITNRSINISNFGTRNFVGFTNLAAGSYYAVRIPATQVAQAAENRNIVIQAATFDTFVTDFSVVPVFAEATLTTGVVNPDGTLVSLNLDQPLARVTDFIGQDNDFAPFYFPDPRGLGQRVRRGIASGEIENLFLVLRLPSTTPFPGVSRQPPFIGLDGIPVGQPGSPNDDAPIFGLSYLSTNNGVTFTRETRFNFRFSLLLSDTLPESPASSDTSSR